MPRSRTFLFGLVLSVLAGGIVGAGVAALIGVSQQGDWLPSQPTAVGACVAAAVGFGVAWLLAGRSRRPAEPDALPAVLPAVVPEPAATVATEPARPDESGGPAQPVPPRAAATPVASPASPTASDLLPAAVKLYGNATTRDAAIEEAGALLVEAGAVEPEYVAAMHQHERSSSTHMGNALAVPRGSHAARGLVHRSALAFVRYPSTVDWHGNRVRFVVAIAGVDGADQVRLVSRVAEVFLDDAVVAQLEATGEVADVVEAFARTGA